MADGLDFETWYAGTSARMATQRAAIEEKDEELKAAKAAALAKGKVAFKGWVMEAAVHDRTLDVSGIVVAACSATGARGAAARGARARRTRGRRCPLPPRAPRR